MNTIPNLTCTLTTSICSKKASPIQRCAEGRSHFIEVTTESNLLLQGNSLVPLFELLCSEAKNASLRDVTDIGLMNEVTVMGPRSYLLEVESICRARIHSGVFLRALEKYRRYRDRCREMCKRLRNYPRSQALVEELARRELQMRQTLGRIRALEE